MTRPLLWIVGTLVAALFVAGVASWKLVFFVAPYSWTREPDRLAALLDLRPGATLADIGAGDGSLAIAMARRLSPTGRVLATELSDSLRAVIASRAARAPVPQVTVVMATSDDTGLPAGCCDAAYARAVMHHIRDLDTFVGRVKDALRPGARFVVIDFPPGGLPFHGADHGVTQAAVQHAFAAAGFRSLARIENWGGGMFALVFQRPQT